MQVFFFASQARVQMRCCLLKYYSLIEGVKEFAVKG
jgi:hypothetical protein